MEEVNITNRLNSKTPIFVLSYDDHKAYSETDEFNQKYKELLDTLDSDPDKKYVFEDLPYQVIRIKLDNDDEDKIFTVAIAEQEDGTCYFAASEQLLRRLIADFEIQRKNGKCKDISVRDYCHLWVSDSCVQLYVFLSYLLKNHTVYRYKQKFSRQQLRLRERKNLPINIVYLSKSPKESVKSLASRHDLIQLESWYRRGHWRRIDGVGKNRQGEYIVQGFTWVVPHTCGNSDVLPQLKEYHFSEAT